MSSPPRRGHPGHKEFFTLRPRERIYQKQFDASETDPPSQAPVSQAMRISIKARGRSPGVSIASEAFSKLLFEAAWLSSRRDPPIF